MKDSLGWNFRIMRRVYPAPDFMPNHEPYTMYGMYEVYYDENEKPTGWSQDPQDFNCEFPDGVAWTIERYSEAIDKPMLEYETGAEIPGGSAREVLARMAADAQTQEDA